MRFKKKCVGLTVLGSACYDPRQLCDTCVRSMCMRVIMSVVEKRHIRVELNWEAKPSRRHQNIALLVEQVQVCRYLGIEMDTNPVLLSTHGHKTYKKAHQRLHLLRKLRTFQVSKDILTWVYRFLIESVLTCNISSWCNQLTIKHKTNSHA